MRMMGENRKPMAPVPNCCMRNRMVMTMHASPTMSAAGACTERQTTQAQSKMDLGWCSMPCLDAARCISQVCQELHQPCTLPQVDVLGPSTQNVPLCCYIGRDLTLVHLITDDTSFPGSISLQKNTRNKSPSVADQESWQQTVTRQQRWTGSRMGAREPFWMLGLATARPSIADSTETEGVSTPSPRIMPTPMTTRVRITFCMCLFCAAARRGSQSNAK